MTELIPLCTPEGVITEYMDKIETHRLGCLHLAFSVLIFNSESELLLQKRAAHKYHSAGLWTNSCCGHPNPGETIQEAAERRLQQEMGFRCQLDFKYKFQYDTVFSDGLIENELDHVFFGRYEGEITPNSDEVSEFRWIKLEDLQAEIKKSPKDFTVWFKMIMLNMI